MKLNFTLVSVTPHLSPNCLSPFSFLSFVLSFPSFVLPLVSRQVILFPPVAKSFTGNSHGGLSVFSVSVHFLSFFLRRPSQNPEIFWLLFELCVLQSHGGLSVCPQLRHFCSARLQATPSDVCSVVLILTWLLKEASTAFTCSAILTRSLLPFFFYLPFFLPVFRCCCLTQPGSEY